MTISVTPDLKAIVFDVYGTLAEIKGHRRSPFKKLVRYAQELGRLPKKDDPIHIMSHPGGLRETAKRLGINLSAEQFQELESDLLIETSSISLFPDVNPTLLELKALGLKVGVCSNLAEPYATPILQQLSVPLDCYAWSFQVGAIKPFPEIYEYLLKELGCDSGEILFVGDTPDADFDGPKQMGMKAKLIDRTTSECLADILKLSLC